MTNANGKVAKVVEGTVRAISGCKVDEYATKQHYEEVRMMVAILKTTGPVFVDEVVLESLNKFNLPRIHVEKDEKNRQIKIWTEQGVPNEG